MAHQVDLWVQVDRRQPPDHYIIDGNVLNHHIPRIGFFIQAWAMGTQTDIAQTLKGYHRRTLQASLRQLFTHLQAYSNGRQFEPFKDNKKALQEAADDANKHRVIVRWCFTLCDICDILAHDGYLGCSNWLFEHLLVAFETLFPQLKDWGMKQETIELFYALTRVFRGTKQVYLSRLHAIWNGLDGERREAIWREINLNRHILGPEKALGRMYYALQNPRKPRNLAGFNED